MNNDIFRREIAKNLGCQSLDAQTNLLAEQAIVILQKEANPKATWKIIPLTHRSDTVLLGGVPLAGKDIRNHLHGCEVAVVMAATLSLSAEQALRRITATDMALALIADAVATAMVEMLCDETEAEIRSKVPYPYVTARFSPGYGDLPLQTQPLFLRLTDATRTLGITATPQHILIPQKSVTAILGCSHQPVQDARKAVCGINCSGCKHLQSCKHSQINHEQE